MSASNPIRITVISDVVCPFCFVGQRRLEAAIQALPDEHVEVLWRPFQLDATLPPEGISREEYFVNKFGSMEPVRRMQQTLMVMGEETGINFAFDRAEIAPNTRDCHRLMHWATPGAQQQQLVAHLFSRFFEEGADFTQQSELLDAAEACGMNRELTKARLDSEEDIDTIARQNDEAHTMGVNGVPFFIIDDRFAISGAQETQTLAAAIQHARQTKSES
ncbi:DsbA family oxidoreductase [Polycladidibacter hongkongensis]|uniref:DsbA family oxidoreductase n=1 Tax=Polycladidibacter hongkongensis TaxID=1647556 RepID=UPI0008344CBF|nr:DsbA family oxidoreductase [Pseudovibrio hongkongensis]